MIRLPLNDFSAGLLSSKYAGRYDMESYLKGAAELTNWLPLPQGGVTYRPGTAYKATTKGTPNAKARLIPWTCGPSTAFIVEIGHNTGTGYIRIFQEVAGTFTFLVEFVNGVSGASVPLSTDAIVAESQTAMDSSALYFAHREYAPRVLTWTGGSNFTFGALAITGYSATAWAALTAYSLNAYRKNNNRIYKCITAGTSAASGGPTGVSASITDGTVVWAYVTESLPFQSANNYPGAIAALNGRLMFAGSITEPQAIWGSKPFQPGNFVYAEHVEVTYTQTKAKASWANPYIPETETVTDMRDVITTGSAFKIELRSEENEYILGMAAARDLLVTTTSSEWILPRDITATNPRAELQSRHGSIRIQPRIVSGFAYFASSPKMFRAAQYVFGSDTYEAQDITILSAACSAGILAWDFSLQPDPTIYIVLADGTLACMARNRLTGSATWYKIAPAVGGTSPAIESVAAIAGADGDDDIYLIVKRGDARHIVKMDRPFAGTHLDSAITATASSGTITGLTHLNGMAIKAVGASGIVYSGTVAAGSVTPTPAIPNGSYLVGLGYTATLRTMRLPVPSNDGSVIGLPRRIARIGLSLDDTLALKVGPSASSLTPKTYTTAKTGEDFSDFAGEWTTDAWVYLVQDTPLKATILALIPELVTEGGA